MKKKLLLLVPALALMAFGISVPTSAKIIRRNNMVTNPATELTAGTFEDLKNALLLEDNVRVTITQNITVTEPLTTGLGTYQIVSNGDVYLTRGVEFNGDMFLVPENSTLTIGVDGTANKITIDGNSAEVLSEEGSIIENFGTVNLLDGVTLTNNKSNGSGSAIYNNVNSHLTIDGAVVSNNEVSVSGKYSAIYVNSNADLNFVSGTVSGNKAVASGAGLFVNTDASFNMESGIFENNVTEANGAAMAIKEDATISNLTAVGNTSAIGGAMWIYNQANVTFSDSTFEENKASSGGAIYIENYTTATFDNCKFIGNTFNVSTAKLSGAGVYAKEHSQINFIDSEMIGNIGSYYGGAIYAKNSDVNLENTNIKNNIAQYGSGINLDASDLTITGGEISGNETDVEVGSGGGIYAYNQSNVNLNDVSIKNNKALNGAGLKADVSTLELNNVNIYKNKASKYGAGLYIDKSTVEQNNSSVRYNVSGASGCGIFNEAGTITINGGDVSFNAPTANNGGGIVNKGNLTINNATLEGNMAPAHGGAIQNYDGSITAVLKINNSTFKDNGKGLTIDGESATVGNSAITTHGGAINMNSGKLEISNSTFINNLSKTKGGAITTNGGEVKIVETTFSGSTSGDSGAINFVATTGTLEDCVFDGNSASTGGAIGVDSDSNIVVKNGTFTNNVATATGDFADRGYDIYIYANGNKNTVATIDGGSYRNIGVQYGIARIGGDLKVSEYVGTYAGIQAAYAHIEIFDVLTNKITLKPRWTLNEANGISNTLIRFDADAKADKYQLLNNIVIDGNYFAKMEDGKAYVRKCAYKIITPVEGGTTCPLGANAGELVTFGAQNGYKVTNVSIDNDDPFIDSETYSFYMPESNVTLTYDLELLPMDIGVDEEALGLISVKGAATLGEKVTVTPIQNTSYRVTNVYYLYNSVKYNLDYDNENNTYSFTMFEGVDLKVEKVELYNIKFEENEFIQTSISSNGKAVTYASCGEEITLYVQSIHSRYMLDLANSYYKVEGDTTKYEIANLSFTMPEGNVTITVNVEDIYASYENIVEVYTFEELIEASKLDCADIIINQDIEVTSTIKFKNYGKYNILGSGNRTIKRANNFTGEMFVIQEFAEVTLGKLNSSDPTNTITFDGNKEEVTSEASMFVVRNSAKLFINNYVKIVNSFVDKNGYYASYGEGVNGTGSGAIYNFNGLIYLNGGEISGHESNGYGGAILNGGYLEVNAGKITNNRTISHGGAIFNTRQTKVNGGEISNNISGKNGGAIYIQNSVYAELKIYGGKITNNTSTDSAGAVFNNSRSFVYIYGGEMTNNISTKGNGGFAYNYGKMIVRGGYFANNSATYKDKNGGAIYVNVNLTDATYTSGELYLFAGLFENNTSYNGGAIALYSDATMFVEEDSAVKFVNNTALNRGGAVYLVSDKIHPSQANILGGEFSGNTSVNGKDIAIQYGVLNIGANAKLSEVSFVANPQEEYGYLNIVSNMSNKFTIVPIAYTENTATGFTFVRFEKAVDTNKILDFVYVKPKTGTTWKFYVKGSALALTEKQYEVVIDCDVRAIDVALNANAGEKLKISARTGYKVTNLKINGELIISSLTNSIEYTMPNTNIEITYDYEYADYLIIIKGNSYGEINTSKVVATINDEVILTVTPNAGYFLKALYINGVKVDAKDNTYTFVTDKNVEVTASFEKIKYIVSFNYNYNNKCETQQIYYGSKVKEITPKRSGYTFAGWYTNVELTDKYNFNTAITGRIQLYAKWVKEN